MIIEGTVCYNPQRVLRQLGYDQGATVVTKKMGNLNILIAEARYVGEAGPKFENKFKYFFAKQMEGRSKVFWGCSSLEEMLGANACICHQQR